MTFPATQLPYHVEIAPGGERYNQWVDITGHVRSSGGVTLEYGQSSEDSRMQAVECSFMMDNRTGNYSPSNPLSPYYPYLRRNTPVRVWVEQDDHYLDCDGSITTVASTPHVAALGITGDIDIRWDGCPVSWGLDNWTVCLIGKVADSTNDRSWALYLGTDGYVALMWSTAGTAGTALYAFSTEPVPFLPNHRGAIRVTLDVNNGASGNTTTFYTSDSIDGTWTQLGSPVVKSGTTSIYNSSAPVELACPQDSTFDAFRMKVYAAQVRDGIAGTVVANPDFRALADETNYFTDSATRVWSAYGSWVQMRDDRFHGELSVAAPVADKSGNDIIADATAFSMLRRLTQGESPLESTLRRGELSTADLVSYWPCEDESGSTVLASGNGGQAMRINGAPSLANYSEYACSKPILTTSTDTELIGAVPAYTPSTGTQISFLMSVPAAGTTNAQEIVALSSTGTLKYWTLVYGTGGTLRFRGYTDPDSSSATVDSGATAFLVNGKLLRVSIDITQDGSAVDWTVSTLEVGQSVGSTMSGTSAAITCGRVSSVVVSPGTNLPDVSIGHISVHSSVRSIFDLSDELNAYDGELAVDRMARLCQEQGVEFVGTTTRNSTAMGPQLPDTFVNLITQCADSDEGIIFEPRVCIGIGYRYRESMYALTPSVTTAYTSLTEQLDPTYDDTRTVNDRTVTRIGGSSARVTDTDGPMGVTAVGRYASSSEMSLARDSQCELHAAWQVHLGTIEDARYPHLVFAMETPPITSSASLEAAIRSLDIGDRIDITSVPHWCSYDDVRQVVIGMTETLSDFEWRITLNTMPFDTWNVGIWSAARFQTPGSTLTYGITNTQTSITVTSSSAVWTTDPASIPFDILIGGERMTVTAVSGATSPQTFTVTRSVNGVVKAHDIDTAISVFNPGVFGL